MKIAKKELPRFDMREARCQTDLASLGCIMIESDQIIRLKNLTKNILLQALFDITKGSGPDKKDAMEWLFSNDTRYLFSFINCCRLLNLSPEKIRSAVKSGTLSEAMEQYKKLQQSYGSHFDKVIGL